MSMQGDASGIFDGMGLAIIILSIFLGVGSCSYLEDKGTAKMIEAKANAQLKVAQAKQIEAESEAGKGE